MIDRLWGRKSFRSHSVVGPMDDSINLSLVQLSSVRQIEISLSTPESTGHCAGCRSSDRAPVGYSSWAARFSPLVLEHLKSTSTEGLMSAFSTCCICFSALLLSSCVMEAMQSSGVISL